MPYDTPEELLRYISKSMSALSEVDDKFTIIEAIHDTVDEIEAYFDEGYGELNYD